jgi:hypothetical protein
MPTFVNRGALDQLLLERFGGRVGRGLAGELSRQHNHSAQADSQFTPTLTGHTAEDEYSAETGDNGQMQTNVCSRAKGVQSMEVAAQPGRGIGCDIGRGEAVEHELDAFISKRHEQRVKSEGERQAEEAWKESVRRYEALRREENRQAWASFHETQAERHRRTLAGLIAGHEEKARKLLKSEIPSLDRPEI